MELVTEKIEMISFDCPICQTGKYMMPNVENIMTAGDYYNTSHVKCFSCNLEIDYSYDENGKFVGTINFNSPNYDVSYVWENGALSIIDPTEDEEDRVTFACSLDSLPNSKKDFEAWEQKLIDAQLMIVTDEETAAE